MRAPVARLFALPAARWTAVVSLLLVAVGLLAGGVRLLPLALAPGVPRGVLPILARGAMGVALETALFVAPALGWTLAAARLVERGEARALSAIGVSPLRTVASGWPAALAVTFGMALVAAAWGREAQAPGRLLGDLVLAARDSCERAPKPASADVPLVSVSWVCVEGSPPLVVAATPTGPGKSAGAFSAHSLALSSDLRALELEGVELILPGDAASGSPVHLHAGSALLRGLVPIGQASNLSVPARVLWLSFTSALLAALAAFVTLRGSLSGRAAALVVGGSGPAGALLVFSALERAPSSGLAYAAMPAAAVLALALTDALRRRLRFQ